MTPRKLSPEEEMIEIRTKHPKPVNHRFMVQLCDGRNPFVWIDPDKGSAGEVIAALRVCADQLEG